VKKVLCPVCWHEETVKKSLQTPWLLRREERMMCDELYGEIVVICMEMDRAI